MQFSEPGDGRVQSAGLPATLSVVVGRRSELGASKDDGEIFDLVVAYARQETVEPLRGVGRWILWGIASMVLVSLGIVLFALGILRAVQDLAGHGLDGTWSFVPYLIGAAFSSIVVIVALTQVRRTRL